MNGGLPRVTSAQIIKVIERAGFVLVRQSGSHRVYRNAAGRRVTVPFHAGAVLHPKVLRSILRDANIASKELRRLL